MDLFRLPRYDRTPEIPICDLIFAGSLSFLISGFFSGSTLYACFSTWPDPNLTPHNVMFPRPFYLAFGLFFGYFFVRITGEIYINIHKKVSRLINYIKSWRVQHSTKDQEEEQEEEEEEGGCPICLEDLGSGFGGGGVVRLRGCLHRFHRGCIDKWLVRRPCCPTCRRSVAVGKN